VSLAAFPAIVFEVRNKKMALRPVQKSDRAALVQFANEQCETLHGPFPATTSALRGKKSEVNFWLSTRLENFRDRKGVFCVIEDSESMKIIGFVSAFQFEWRTPKCELSWFVAPEAQRQGIAEKCCRHMIAYLFSELGLNKILCRISPENDGSIRLAEKLSFQKEGLHRRDFRDGHDNLLDVLYFGLLA
jgi:RimJ/RimL family protein N-acetyltransferase